MGHLAAGVCQGADCVLLAGLRRWQNGDLIMLYPPLIVNEANLAEMVAILTEAVYEALPVR